MQQALLYLNSLAFRQVAVAVKCLALCDFHVVHAMLGAQVQGVSGPTRAVFSCDGVFSPFSDTINITTSVTSVEIVRLPAQLPFPTGFCSLPTHAFKPCTSLYGLACLLLPAQSRLSALLMAVRL